MRSTLILAALAVGADAYVRVSTTAQRSSSALGMGYVPDGLTAEQYAKMKKKEADDKKTKKFAAGGTRGFQSRSMASFIMAKEAGKAEHLFPVDPETGRGPEIKRQAIGVNGVAVGPCAETRAALTVGPRQAR